jgi:phage terminase large subunit-like protein
LSSLSPEAIAELRWKWDFWARPNQLEPGPVTLPDGRQVDWSTWLVMAGRGFGKTRMGSEWVRSIAEKYPGCQIALVAETAADARDVMILGESGIIKCDPNLSEDSWSPTNRRLRWPNGTQAWVYNATQPDQLRGPQHHFAWVDELAKFQYMQATWDQLMFGLRLGENPKTLVTTTPRPLPLIKKLVAQEASGKVYVTRGATLDNKDNLAKSAVEEMYDTYAGTRLGRQELNGEILEDMPGALWNMEIISDARLTEESAPSQFERIYVAVDPAASSNDKSDENGIVVVGLARDKDGYARGYLLEDGSLKGTPQDWASKAVKLYRKYEADKIIAEKNNGGEMVEHTIKSVDRSVPVELVHASRGKMVRAEPISTLYEQGRIHHVGIFPLLEDQMCSFTIDNIRNDNTGSPDRVDALVWGFTKLFDKIAGRRRQRVEENVIDNTNKDTQPWDPALNYQYNDSPNSWMGV